ncbi:uncharacterized protein K460DRAFT_369367 [Cucurbitaria berberidis CBS 394.84]|uniref:Uncharacterized protein n=1 Tax=Cucurbitaria berberidis CBS 394.84 TaxID=1168544 RepID=A0A9P4G9T5_9PLEO|nr:uncharacterized protein K460DRAFT_369367 [Cucurbitaria berberidis CBS 394.84]KAF1841330.1 hypothetical protein K460DRAFT_369367 [Cucurbitaria berberidis CBS 394.84]
MADHIATPKLEVIHKHAEQHKGKRGSAKCVLCGIGVFTLAAVGLQIPPSTPGSMLEWVHYCFYFSNHGPTSS